MSENSDKSSEISDAMRLVKLAAEPRLAGDSVKAAIRRSARALRWEETRTRDVWYGNARRIDASEMDALRALSRQRDRAGRASLDRGFVEQLAALRARLQTRDAEFHREDIAAIEWAIGLPR